MTHQGAIMRTGVNHNIVPVSAALAAAVLALSSCGQLAGSTSTKVKGVDTSGLSVSYTSPTNSTTPSSSPTNSSTIVSGATSSSPPMISSSSENGGSNTVSIGTSLTFVAPFVADASLT